MSRRLTLTGIATAIALSASAALAHDEVALAEAPPPAPYAQVSELVSLPEFIPGLGTLYVDPNTLPAGPFLGYDRDGRLAATIYMTPMADLRNGASFDELAVGAHHVASVDVYYNAGHPGVEEPHAHVVLYHADDARARLGE
ncbi:hypothetical protein [Sediminicurvatus halobius]|uniref:Uncharacterized protein n=1 Tax=Sediminicurvatus halobius TaxID=2182432 RepID=A0A2U2MX04_9GAMM|nr:hypothetical protein [Spiribacter halobius]PWG61387.1 hypothetical protein DEM34_16860 [Spiribacter halobius]UEX76600.1 hypothetical protein LMH63_11595 [Spiribacter halobius]